MTQDYVLVASDRRLTFVDGPNAGRIADDKTCKLVSLCGLAGIAYTGLARIAGVPTHEWIAGALADHACSDVLDAGDILESTVGPALGSGAAYAQTIIIAGWGLWAAPIGLRPVLQLITNMHDGDGKRLPGPSHEFQRLWRRLADDEEVIIDSIGCVLGPRRRAELARFLRRLVVHRVSPEYALRALVDEIQHTATLSPTVGASILCLCIPRLAAERTLSGIPPIMLASDPNLRTASFNLVVPESAELRQYGPTWVCGGGAMTDVIVESDPSTGNGSITARLLRTPGPRP